MGSTRLYLGGGFKEETKSVLISNSSVMDIAALESTQEEADTRVILHSMYSVQNEGWSEKGNDHPPSIPEDLPASLRDFLSKYVLVTKVHIWSIQFSHWLFQ